MERSQMNVKAQEKLPKDTWLEDAQTVNLLFTLKPGDARNYACYPEETQRGRRNYGHKHSPCCWCGY
jgi:hypothetical protein